MFTALNRYTNKGNAQMNFIEQQVLPEELLGSASC